MKNGLLIMLISGIICNTVQGQNSQTVVSVESRIGYSTNTYLNPFFSEWNSSLESGYGVVSLLGQTFWYQNSHSIEVTGGLVVEPFFEGQDTWKGGLGLLRYQKRFSGHFSGGIEAGTSYFTSSFDRTMAWIQPSLTWFLSPFSLVRIKASSNFRSYKNFSDSLNTDASQRIDLYALELETWPGFHWHIKAGLYGQLETLPSVQESFSSVLSVGYVFRRGARFRLYGRLEQYQQSITTTTSGGPGPGPGFPPIGPPSGSTSTQTETETDRIIRLGLSADYPVNRKWSLFVRAERLEFYSTKTENNFGDIQLSGGVRFSFEPRIRKGTGSITPEWNKKATGQTLRIHYKGEGRLYLVGDFNNWNRLSIPLREQSENTFVTQLNLEPGAYEYKILRINGATEEWIEFSKDSYTIPDGFGDKNALLLVE